jgi:single-strand DNA-binding protein
MEKEHSYLASGLPYYTPAGKPYLRMSVAVNRTWANDKGEKQVDTTWFRVTVWGKQAEACNQYLSKGRMVLVEAEQIKASAYMSRDNQPAATLEIVARNVRFLGGNGNGNGKGATGSEQPVEEVEDNEPAI